MRTRPRRAAKAMKDRPGPNLRITCPSLRARQRAFDRGARGSAASMSNQILALGKKLRGGREPPYEYAVRVPIPAGRRQPVNCAVLNISAEATTSKTATLNRIPVAQIHQEWWISAKVWTRGVHLGGNFCMLSLCFLPTLRAGASYPLSGERRATPICFAG
jgi:hypothetical protein